MKKTKTEEKLRIVSLAPSATSILCAIGARNALVGATVWCEDVAPVKDLPKVGDCWRVEPQDVLALKPTLVIGSMPFKPETVAKLLEHPLTFLALNPRSLADIEADIRLLGRIADCSKKAERLVRHMRTEFEKVAGKTPKRRTRPRAYCEAWPNPRISSPPWVAELTRIAGGEFVVAAGEKVSDEQVAAARPDVIVLAWAATGDRSDPRKAYSVAAWKDVPAIQNRQVYVVRDELLNTPGPPLVEGVRALHRIFHGDRARRSHA